MNSKNTVFSLAFLILGCMVGDGISAQNIKPVPVELGTLQSGRLDDSAPRQANNHPFACYALNTKPGAEVSIRVKSSAFDPALAVARGALCTAAALQFENDNVDETSKDALVSFRAAGGRYLIFVRGTSPASRGSYQLSLEAGLSEPAPKQATASDDAQMRRQIMAMEIEKRNAELAAAEAKRKAEQAQAQAQRAALLAEQQTWQQYEEYEEYEDDYDDAPTPNFMDVFASTLANELAAQQQAQQEFQRGLDQAIRRGEAEYQRRMAAEQAAEARQRQQQASRQAAAQQMQAAEAQRLAAERARAAAEAAKRVALAQEQRTSSAQRTPDRLVARPAGSQTPAASSSPHNNRASTRNDPSTCVTGPDPVKNPNCPNGAAARVWNQCEHTIDARICHWTTRDRWDCGVTTVRPGASGGFPSCFGTGRMWMTVQYSDTRTKFADPP